MPINPNIALSFQAPQIDDPLNKMAQIEQIKAYRQNALAREREAQLAEREIENMNALRKLYAGGEAPTLAQSVATGGKAGLEMFKAQAAAQKEMALQKKAQQEALMKTVEMGKSRLQSMQDTPEAYSKFYQGFVTEFPEMAPYFADPSTYKPGRGGTKESLLMTAEQLSSDRRSQEQLSSQIAQNLANQINQLSSKIFKVTPEGVPVTDPYALRQYQQLVNRFASFSAMPQGQVGGADAILRAPIDDVTSQIGGASPPPPAPPYTPPAEGMPGERTIPEQIATAKAMQAASEKSAQEQVVSAAAKKKNVEMANKLLERIGYDPEKDTTTTDQLIAESTGGGLQKLGADVAGYFNVTTEGMENIGALQTLSTEISKDFLGGNLGSGISNADREFIERMTGDIGNPEIPVDQRRAAFREFVKGLKMIKERGYFFGSPAAPSAPSAPSDPSKTVTDDGWSIEVVP